MYVRRASQKKIKFSLINLLKISGLAREFMKLIETQKKAKTSAARV